MWSRFSIFEMNCQAYIGGTWETRVDKHGETSFDDLIFFLGKGTVKKRWKKYLISWWKQTNDAYNTIERTHLFQDCEYGQFKIRD